MSSVLVSGAASGIGKAFVSSLSQKPEVAVIYAVDRSFPSEDVEVTFALPYETPCRIEQIKADIADEESVQSAAKDIREDLFERDARLDFVVHSAGVRGLDPSVPIGQPSDVVKAESLENMTSKTVEEALQINSVGSFRLLQALVPMLSTSPRTPAKVMVMSSRMGSIGNNKTGGGHAYRASKAAQNAIVRSMAVDVPEAHWVLVHPGRVETGLVDVKEDDAIPPEQAVEDIMAFVPMIDKKHSGTFIDRFQKAIPW